MRFQLPRLHAEKLVAGLRRLQLPDRPLAWQFSLIEERYRC
jgi:hypothetical protein